MNKTLLTLFFALISMGVVQAQTLSIVYQGQVLENGVTVDINGELSDDPFYEIVAHAQIKNNSDRAVEVFAQRINHDTVTGSKNYFCWDACYPPFVDNSTSTMPIGAGQMTGEGVFSGHYEPKSHLGISKIEYVFFPESNHDDKVSFIVNFRITPSSLDSWKESVQFSNAYPNPATTAVNFDFSFPTGTQQAKVKIVNLVGQTLAEQKIEQSSGKVRIAVDHLKEGVYFYSLIIDNQSVVSKKLIIKK